jgi:c(7)-type cytochrome triheme protein
VAIQTKDVGTIPFSHAEHGRMFACDECHPDTFKACQGRLQQLS